MSDNIATVIRGARVFDGVDVRSGVSVVLDAGRITDVIDAADQVPVRAHVVEANVATLLPGLIDSHVHADEDGLATALRFGVTTVLEMGGHWTSSQRADISRRTNLADLRSAGFGVTAPHGHPCEFYPDGEIPGIGDVNDDGATFLAPFASNPADADKIVDNMVRTGSDYIKIYIETGQVMGQPGLATLTPDTVTAAVTAAHRHDRLAIAHGLTAAAADTALSAGVDGLAHLFVDRAATTQDAKRLREAQVFVMVCLVVNSSLLGRPASALAADPRVAARLSSGELDRLRRSFDTDPSARWDDVVAGAKALRDGGVDVLVGTDSNPNAPGIAFGASVHHELQLLVDVGFTPVEALRAATSVPADRFGLADRGRIAPGRRADLLLVDGDPTSTIGDTLSIRQVWRGGVAQL